MKDIVVFTTRSRLPVKLIDVLPLGHHQQLLVYLNLFPSFYSNCSSNYNVTHNQYCNDLLDQSHFFDCYYMFFSYF